MKIVLVDALRIMVFIIVQMLIAISNALLMKRLNSFPKAKQRPKVSVLIPVRNEEKSIINCLHSLLMQNYDNYEIVVLNDNSSDNTDKILNSINDDKIKLIEGKPLPDDWIGKSWACFQLSKNAQGELLLFTDADTIYQPNTISCAVNALIATKADLITAVHCNQVKTFGEKITVPFPVYAIFTILPLTVAYLFPKSSPFSTANGKFMLFDKDFYEKIDGHRAVKQEIVEDIALAKLVKSRGGKWRIFDASTLIVSRMYENFADAINGFTKNYFAIFNYRILLSIFVWFWMGLITFYPIVGVFSALIRQNFNLNFIYNLVSIIIKILFSVIFIFTLSNNYFGFSIYWHSVNHLNIEQ